MKNFRKLVFASIMLVFALVAVVSSTVAWFTMQQEAQVNEIKLGASAEGLDLQISTNGTDWAYVVDITSPTGAQMSPTTFDASDKNFMKLDFDVTPGADLNKFKYVPATLIAPGATTGEGYLAFDLHFRSANTKLSELYLNVTGSTFAAKDPLKAEVLDTLRVMFLVSGTSGEPAVLSTDFNANTLIYEPNHDINSTFGNGEYFKSANNYIAEEAFTHSQYNFFESALEDGYYKLNDTFFTGRTYSTKTLAQAQAQPDIINGVKGLKVADMTANTVLTIKVFLWIEGWDGDTNNTAALQEYTSLLKFTAK